MPTHHPVSGRDQTETKRNVLLHGEFIYPVNPHEPWNCKPIENKRADCGVWKKTKWRNCSLLHSPHTTSLLMLLKIKWPSWLLLGFYWTTFSPHHTWFLLHHHKKILKLKSTVWVQVLKKLLHDTQVYESRSFVHLRKHLAKTCKFTKYQFK